VLPQLQSGIEEYAEKLKSRQGLKDVDQLIQEMGGAWHSGGVTPEGIAYEKFLNCAIPGLGKMKDPQAVLEFMADACFKKDPVAFMDRVRKDCGPLLSAPKGGGAVQDLEAVAEAARARRPPAAGVGELRQALAQGEEGRGPGHLLEERG
jgi:hypothetical protein